MPQQLIYTSAPRGLVAGRSGHCTVARSATMREALMLQLEKLSYYQHLSLSGGQERPIYSCRLVDLRGSRYHVLSRIQDAGLDFTGRTNFLAHHLVFTPEEVRQLPSPPVILREWPGWVKTWSKEPQLLDNEDWSGLSGLAASVAVPAVIWKQITGAAVNGYGLLESRAGTAFRVDQLTEEQILTLFAESLELLELRDPRRDFRATAWQYTFTTSMQDQDNPADFRWRCLHSDNPAANRFAGADCCPLSGLRALRVTSEETVFAQSGRQPPGFVVQPQNARITEGDTARLQAQAEGVPSPDYQWYALDRAGNGQVIANGTDAELVVPNPPLGVSRYVVRASNSQGEVTSAVATVSVEQKLRPQPSFAPASGQLSRVGGKAKIDVGREFESLNSKYNQNESAQESSSHWKWLLIVTAVVVVLVCSVLFGNWRWNRSQQQPSFGSNGSNSSNAVLSSGNPSDMPPTNATGASNTAKPQLQPVESMDTNLAQATKEERRTTIPPATEFKLPEGWMLVAIGNASTPNAEFISPRYDLSGSAEGFAAQGDSAWFVCKTNITKSFQATLIRNEVSQIGSVCGVMARESEKTNASFLFIGASPSKIITCRRDGAGKFESRTNDILQANQNKPISFRLDLDATNIVPSYSFLGPMSWQRGGLSSAVSKVGPMMIGLAISSGSSSDKVIAKFGAVLEQ